MSRIPIVFAWFPALLSFACSNGDAPTGSDTEVSCPSEPTEFTIADDTNYVFASSLEIEMATLKDATDLRFDWTSITQDFFGRALDAAGDIDMVLVSLWEQTPDELNASLTRDTLERNAGEGAIMTYPDGSFTQANLLSFGVLGNPLPDESEIWSRFDTTHPSFEYPQDQYTFLLMASTGTTIGRGARMLAMFNLDPNATQTEVTLTNDSTRLEYEVRLTEAQPVSVPSGQASLTIQWGEMTINALGNEFLPTQITEAVVAHFATDSLAELEAQFLNLETIADGWWTGPVAAGTSLDLGTLRDASGAPFPGIDENGTWLVALFCTTGACNNPAPWSITILEPCE
jgi:hypothetical protein